MGNEFADVWLTVAAVGGLLYAFGIGLGTFFGALPIDSSVMPYSLSLIVAFEYMLLAALAIASPWRAGPTGP